MIPCILFDLDDTLYLEADFVAGGFRAVANELERRAFGESESIYRGLIDIHWMEGRDHVFDKAASRVGFPASVIPDLVRIYRGHPPSIRLAVDAAPALETLASKAKVGCVTDGIADVQHRKVGALGLSRWIKEIIFTDELGPEFWKPHPLALELMCDRFGVLPRDAIFVGDNPARDMRAAKNAGLRSVRIRRPGGYFSGAKEMADIPDCTVTSLTELIALVDVLYKR